MIALAVLISTATLGKMQDAASLGDAHKIHLIARHPTASEAER
jgi:hypothetical protein